MSPDAPADRARELALEARDDPSVVDATEVRELLSTDPDEARWYALQAARRAARGGELDLSAFVDPFVDELDAESERVRSTAAMALGDLADRSPSAVADRVEPMAPLVDDDGTVGSAAVDFVYRIAVAAADDDSETPPSALEPAVPTLRALFADEDAVHRETALFALGAVAPAFTDELAADVEALRDAFVEGSDPGIDADTRTIDDEGTIERLRETATRQQMTGRNRRNAAARTLVAVARDRPASVEPIVPDVVDLLDDPNPIARRDALEILEAVGSDSPEALEPHVDAVAARLDDTEGVRERAALALVAASQSSPAAVAESLEPMVDVLVEFLDHEEPAVRGGAVGLLSYLGETAPELVDPEPVRPLLDDEHAYVRGNAVWVVGTLGDERAREEVRERAESDPDRNVREAAAAVVEGL